MTDYLILLLSTDWFLPYWTEVGIDIPQDKRIGVQQGCREIINEMLGGLDKFDLVDFSDNRRRVTESRFPALLSRWNVELEVSMTWKEWANLTHKELTAVVLCARLNSQVASADVAGIAPHLEFTIRAEVVKTWEEHALKADVFQDVCLSSKTAWDIRTQKLLVSSKTLVNQLWRVLLNRRLRAFWADLRERLTPSQFQELISWYRAMINASTNQDGTVLLPAYVEA
jgi:hypothetical protein